VENKNLIGFEKMDVHFKIGGYNMRFLNSIKKKIAIVLLLVFLPFIIKNANFILYLAK